MAQTEAESPEQTTAEANPDPDRRLPDPTPPSPEGDPMGRPNEPETATGAPLRPNLGNAPEFKESITRIGRKVLAHGISGPDIREYLGFGAIAARETARRVLANADVETANKWRTVENQVVATLAELPPEARTRDGACKMVFGIWEGFAAKGKKDLLDPELSFAPAYLARQLMKRALPEHLARDIPDELPPKSPPPSLPTQRKDPSDYADLDAMYARNGPILHAARAGQHLMLMAAKGAGELADHPDGVLSALGSLLGSIGSLLIQYDPLSSDMGIEDDRDACGRKLRALLQASTKAGFRLSDGADKGIPRPDEIGWCARQVRSALAEIDFLDLPAYEEWPAEPAIQEDPESIAKAFETRWQERTNRPCPVTGVPALSAIRDMQLRLDGEWARLGAEEKSRQVVMACLRRAGVKKPSFLFDAERKKEERAELQQLGARRPRRKR